MGVCDLTRADFVARFGGVFEHSPWVAESAYDRGLDSTCETAAGLHRIMADAMQSGSETRQSELINAHPDLAGRLARAGRLTADSTKEQASAGLDQLTDEERTHFTTLNDAYKAKFGFPFITAVRLHDSLKSVFMALEQRTQNELDVEMAESLRQIGEVLRGRVGKLFGIPMGWLSMHVLDNVSGLPANGMAFSLSMLQGKKWSVISEGRTNAEGRTEAPLLCDASMKRGVYQFEFGVADYFRQQGAEIAEIPFLDRVPVRFGIDDLALHYHVPLLCTPWAYSTYRGN